jgi:hypothetical protein
MSKPELRIDWATHEAAKYACLNWHYSKSMPKSKLVKVGAWEKNIFIGVVIFSYGATPQIGSPYGLAQNEICELTRIALTNHESFVSEIMANALRKLKHSNPGLRLVVSFADMEQGHHGGIYQATNWIYAGTTKPGRVGFVVNGKKIHTRTVGSIPGGVQSLNWVKNKLDKNATEWIGTEKHRYLMPLDKKMRKQILPLSQPYPKRPKQAMAGSTGTAEGQHLPGRSIDEAQDGRNFA